MIVRGSLPPTSDMLLRSAPKLVPVAAVPLALVAAQPNRSHRAGVAAGQALIPGRGRRGEKRD